jgi:Mn-containing catalase
MRKFLRGAFESLGVDWVRSFASKTDGSKMTDVRRLEEMNLHGQQWFFSNEESGLANIFTGASPFDDGQFEALDGLPQGISIPESPEAPQDCRALDKTLKEKIMAKGS